MTTLNTYCKYYKLNYNECPCDVDFFEYLLNNNIKNKNIFHYGTGGHHYLGIENFNKQLNNDILGITAQKEEYISYIDLIINNPKININYKVFFSDIFTLNKNILPNFDLITLFHHGEYYDPEKNSYCNLNETTLLELMINKLNKNGLILFYKRSAGRHKSNKILQEYSEKNILVKIEEFKSIIIYKKNEH